MRQILDGLLPIRNSDPDQQIKQHLGVLKFELPPDSLVGSVAEYNRDLANHQRCSNCEVAQTKLALIVNVQ